MDEVTDEDWLQIANPQKTCRKGLDASFDAVAAEPVTRVRKERISVQWATVFEGTWLSCQEFLGRGLMCLESKILSPGWVAWGPKLPTLDRRGIRWDC